MAALPFHYFLALREDWIVANTAPSDEPDERGATAEEVVEWNAETYIDRSAPI